MKDNKNKKRKKILAIIPARGGSKGIKNKNIRLFCGKPLVANAILCARGSKYINRIIVSTNDKKIAAVAIKYGAEVPFLRPTYLAGDKSPITKTVFHLLGKLKQDEKYEPDYIVLVQPTSPIREAKDIDNALDL